VGVGQPIRISFLPEFEGDAARFEDFFCRLVAVVSPPLTALQSRPISTLANFSPIFARSTDRDELERLCSEHPYQQFPLITNGQLIGTINRNKILGSQSPKIEVDPAEAIHAHSTIREAVDKMVGNSMSLLVVLSATENTPIGIVTLHDVLRLQTQLSDAALL
jgi:predicted transcriptional regulator